MLKWLKKWFKFRKELPIIELPKVTEEKRLAKREAIFQEGIKRKPALKKATTRKDKEMPLIKSAKPAAFKKNIKTEIKAGKPVKQAVAIAYSEKNAAKKTTSKGKK